MQTLEYNPVLLFKKQDDKEPNKIDNFVNNDNLLCIQTQFQRDMLIKFGNITICLNAIHGKKHVSLYF